MFKSKKILFIICIGVCAVGIDILKTNYGRFAPKVVSFRPVGEAVAADNITGIFVALGKIYISLDSHAVESAGVVNYWLLHSEAQANTPLIFESLTFDPKKYSLYGGITVGKDGRPRIATRDLESGGFAGLEYSQDNILSRVEHYEDSDASVLQIYNGYYDSSNFYLNLEYDNPAGGTLCQFPLDGNKQICYIHIMPALYAGDFFVTDHRVYYSDNLRVSSRELSNNALRQVGIKLDEIGKGITPAGGLLSFYGNNIYIAARIAKGHDVYMAVCRTLLTANHYKRWKCSYDPKLAISDTSNITSFNIDQETAELVISISNYDKNNTQLYTLPVSALLGMK